MCSPVLKSEDVVSLQRMPHANSCRAMGPSMHPQAPHSLPVFIPPPDGTDYLLIGTAIFLIAFVFAIGIVYLRLHALPDNIAHKSQKMQFEIVCVLGLLAMFTHVHAFWIAALLLALIDFPDFSTPLRRISGALDRIAADRQRQIAGSGRDGAHPEATTILLPRPAAQPSRGTEQLPSPVERKHEPSH